MTEPIEGGTEARARPPNRNDAAWIAGLCGPTLLFAWTLKANRLGDISAALTPLDLGELFASEFAVAFSYVAMLALALKLTSGWARTGCQIAAQLSALFYLTLVQAMHTFYKTTGAALGFENVKIGLASLLDGNAALVSSELPASRVLGYSIAVAAMAILPWLLERSRPRPGHAPERRLGRSILAIALGWSAIFASTWAGGHFGRDIVRDPFLHLIISAAASEASEADRAASSDLTDYPTGATSLRNRSNSGEGEGNSDRPHKNLVIIMLESTSFASTSMANRFETTPYLAELYRQGVFPERMVAVVPHTSKALVAILCGIEPRPGFGTPEVQAGGIPGRCLPGLLRDRGYETVMMQSAKGKFEHRRDLVRELEFEDFRSSDEMDATDLDFSNYFGFEDRILLGPSREWLNNRRDPGKPFFFAYLTNAPHHNYLRLDRYGFEDFGGDEFEPKSARNRHLNSIRYVDFILRELMAQYEELGLLDETVFMIVGDHGEAFGEHDRRSHDEVPYEEGMRVPMVLYEPGSSLRPQRRPGIHSHLDIVPTALDRLGFEAEGGRYPGRSLLGGNHGERAEDRIVYASCYAARKCIARWQGDEKFIHFFGLRPDALFDLASDPGELHNLASGRAEDIERYAGEALAWRATLWSLYERSLEKWVTNEPPEIQHPLNIRYGDSVILLGYSTDSAHVVPGRSITIRYYFRVLKPLPEGYEIFVHARDGDEIYSWKHVPVMNLYPEALWQAGDYITDPHRREVSSRWQGERLSLRLGFKHPALPKLKSDPPAEKNAPWIIDLEVRHDSLTKPE
jgi:lipoteichoic acid synthase